MLKPRILSERSGTGYLAPTVWLAAWLLLAGAPVLAATNTEPTLAEEPTTEETIYPTVEEFMETVDVEDELLVESTSKEEPTASPDVHQTLRIGGFDAFFGGNFQLLRIAPPDYEDGISELATHGRLSPREISNIVLSQSGSVPSSKRASDMVWQWGQFLDHDIDLTEPDEEHPESEPIPVPLGDPFFDPLGNGGVTIPFTRSVFDPATGTSLANPRQQINTITDIIDASNVYGSDSVRTQTLRTLDGTGRLKTSSGDLLPFNTFGLPNAGGASRTDLFVAGDVRVNEQVALTVMHTLWMREHNFWADRIRKARPFFTGDQVFEAARAVVTFEMQIITYNEFLPVILGSGALGAYPGHDPSVDPRIANVFSTAAYRLGHTMLSPTILRLDNSGNPISAGPLDLRDAFFAPTEVSSVGLEPYLKGLSSQIMQKIDNLLVDDVRNFLFGPPGAGGLDLGSLNIQRGRDHGLPDYNTFRIAYGLTPAAGFSDVSSDSTVQTRLANAYLDVNEIDPWVGALSEDHVSSDTLMGELLFASLTEQFERLREGDPGWYQNRLSPAAALVLEKQTLAKVIVRNTTLHTGDLQKNVFIVP